MNLYVTKCLNEKRTEAEYKDSIKGDIFMNVQITKFYSHVAVVNVLFLSFWLAIATY